MSQYGKKTVAGNRLQKGEISFGRRGLGSLVGVLGPVETVVTKKAVVKGQEKRTNNHSEEFKRISFGSLDRQVRWGLGSGFYFPSNKKHLIPLIKGKQRGPRKSTLK